MKNQKITVQPEGASQPVVQDVGGWQVMPRDHFDALMRAVDGKKKPPPGPPSLPNKEEVETGELNQLGQVPKTSCDGSSKYCPVSK